MLGIASTGARLEAYLARKLRERGVAEDADGRTAAIDVPALVARLVELGYVDDAAYARMRARDLGQQRLVARAVAVVAADRLGVRIACGQGILVVTHLQRPGGKMLPAGEFLAGYPLVVGEVLASAEMPAFVSDRPFPRAPKA